ncbi:hypothetical protein NEOKW01_0757 [Nematocida sp. AWRm80]|nr:hypothetical protein NEOKW01_0757 [Nematocida sp. AWRm80]
MESTAIYEMIRGIKDPEYDCTLEDLKVVDSASVEISNERITVYITPTIPHCSMVSIIGLSILYKITRSIDSKYIVRAVIREGTHVLEEKINLQLEDIDRVFSAFNNESILNTILGLLQPVQSTTDKGVEYIEDLEN